MTSLRIILFSLFISLVFMLLGCKKADNQEKEINNVANLKVESGDASVTISWNAPNDDNYSYAEITFTPSNDIPQPIIISAPESSKEITNLQNGQEYSFIIVAVGKNSARSMPIEAKATPVESQPEPDDPGDPGEPEPVSGTFIDERDGHEYKWVKIGDQTWMAENLSYIPNGAEFSGVGDHSTNTDYSKHYYIYGFALGGDPTSNAEAMETLNKYGILYNWYAAIDLPEDIQDTASLNAYIKTHEKIKGIAPTGWHIPSDNEIMVLETYLGMTSDDLQLKSTYRGGFPNAGGALMSNEDWEEGNGLNTYGFNLLPGGRWKNKFEFKSQYAYLWTSTFDRYVDQSGESQVRSRLRFFKFNQRGINRDAYEHFNGYSVRCIKDE